MAVKLSSLTLSKRTPNWVSLYAHISSISCAINFQSTQKSDQSQSKSTDFEAKIQFLKNKLHPDSLVSVLNSTPDLNSSLKLFKWASLQKEFHHTADTYHMMILKLGMAGNVEEMEGFCYEMVREKCRGFDKSLSALIDSFVTNRRLSEALRVLYVMNSNSFKPSIGIFNELMHALLEGKRDFKDVLFVYKEMVKAGIPPNIDTLNYLLEALFESGRVDTAIDHYRRINKKGCNPNIRTFQIVISGLVSRNRVEESIAVLEEMFQNGREPDSSFYAHIIPLFCGLKNLDIGLKLFKMMRASNISPDSVTYGALVRCLCEYLQMDDAIKLFEEMIASNLLPDHEVYLDIIKGFCKVSKFIGAHNFLEERNLLDTSLHNALLGFYCNSGKVTLVTEMFDKMSERKITDASSWNIIIRFLCDNAMIKKASEYLCRMVISSYFADSVTYSALVLGNCKIGKVANALDLFSHIRSKYWVLDSATYAEFIVCLCRVENLQEAVDAFCYMSGKGCGLQSGSFNILIEKICASGEVKKAMELLSLAYYTSSPSLGAVYNSILRGLSKSGEVNYLLVILSKMIIGGYGFDVDTYCSLIRSMSDVNRTRNCVSVFNLMLSEDLMPDSETLARLLTCLAKNSQMHLILPSIDGVVSKYEILDSTMYNILISSLWSEGHKSKVSCLLDLMLEKGWVPHASTHAYLIGTTEGKEMLKRKSWSENFGAEDNVSFILEEGLGKM